MISFLVGAIFIASSSHRASAQELHQDLQGTWRAKVIEIVKEEERLIPGTDTRTEFQTIRAELVEGSKRGEIVTVENDYLNLDVGDRFISGELLGEPNAELKAMLGNSKEPRLFTAPFLSM